MRLINSLARSLQSRGGGIPSVAVRIYKLVAVNVLRGLHEVVAGEIKSLVKAGGTVLDIGCGTGSLLAMVCSLSNCYLIGLDISEGMVSEAAKTLSRCGCPYDLILGDAHRLPLREASVDVAVCTGALHHMRDPRVFFSECFRVIKRGCRALIYEFSPDLPAEEFRKTAEEFGVPSAVIRLVATLHGIPREEFVRGRLKSVLKEFKHEIVSLGAVTKVVLTKQ